MNRFGKYCALCGAAALGWWTGAGLEYVVGEATGPNAKLTLDWPEWGGDSAHNNTPIAQGIPTDWNIGEFDYKTGEWDPTEAKNIKWVSRLGSQTYGNAVVSDGKIYVGTNNSGGWIDRYPAKVDLGCLLCFDLETGKFLWQHSSEKLPSGRVHDWPLQGICCAPLVEGNRLWFVTSRGEVRCLDTEGFYDGENDGNITDEEEFAKSKTESVNAANLAAAEKTGKEPVSVTYDMKNEADVIWVYNMMEELGISQHNMCSCSVTAAGDILFVNTSNGVDVEHNYIPAPEAPSFFAMNKNTGEVLWTDNSPAKNILHGQWSSPSYGEFEGQPQVIFAGGDGWVYSFDPQGEQGKSKLLWKFDANPKTSVWELGGRGTRNNIIATPVLHNGKVYVAVGQDPEHGEGIGHLWCIDPNKRGDVSPELAFNSEDPEKVIPHKRVQAVVPEEGDLVRPNPNSAVIWHYSEFDQNSDGEIDFEETMHRSCGTVAIRDNVLYIADFSGLFHCLNAETGEVNWTYDMLAAAWGSPLIVEDKVYIGDEDGEVCIFRHSADPSVAMRLDEEMILPEEEERGDDAPFPYYSTRDMGNSVYSTPIVSNNVLYISNRTHLFAIAEEE